MTIEALREQMITVMKAGNKFKKEVLSSTLSTAKNMAIEKGCKDNISEEIVNAAILKELKTATEMLDTCPSDRLEQLEEFTLRIEILKEIAPTMMDKSEIERYVIQLVEENNIELIAKNKGQIMKVIMPNLKGKADGKLVNTVVQEILKNE